MPKKYHKSWEAKTQKWEYLEVLWIFGKDMRIIPSKGNALFSDKGDAMPKFSEYLDALGREGWELVNAQERDVLSYNHATYYFKRPVE